MDLPSQPLEDKLSFGFGILGTHAFPTDLFEAKYVITADPFPWCYEVSSVAQKLNDQFLALKDTYFTYETSFDMGNGTVFTVWRRDRPSHPGRGQRLSGGLLGGGRPVPRAVQPGHQRRGATKRDCVRKWAPGSCPMQGSGCILKNGCIHPILSIYRRSNTMMKLYGAPICKTCREVKQVPGREGHPL